VLHLRHEQLSKRRGTEPQPRASQIAIRVASHLRLALCYRRVTELAGQTQQCGRHVAVSEHRFTLKFDHILGFVSGDSTRSICVVCAREVLSQDAADCSEAVEAIREGLLLALGHCRYHDAGYRGRTDKAPYTRRTPGRRPNLEPYTTLYPCTGARRPNPKPYTVHPTP
jgi:hypothetical protein